MRLHWSRTMNSEWILNVNAKCKTTTVQRKTKENAFLLWLRNQSLGHGTESSRRQREDGEMDPTRVRAELYNTLLGGWKDKEEAKGKSPGARRPHSLCIGNTQTSPGHPVNKGKRCEQALPQRVLDSRSGHTRLHGTIITTWFHSASVSIAQREKTRRERRNRKCLTGPSSGERAVHLEPSFVPRSRERTGGAAAREKRQFLSKWTFTCLVIQQSRPHTFTPEKRELTSQKIPYATIYSGFIRSHPKMGTTDFLSVGEQGEPHVHTTGTRRRAGRAVH